MSKIGNANEADKKKLETIKPKPSDRLADKIWKLYKKVIVFPSLTEGLEKKIGIALYLICFALSCGFVITMYYDSGNTYSDYQMEVGGSSMAVKHRIPDIVACPVPEKATEYDYNVVYNTALLQLMNMTTEDVNALTAKKFATCAKTGPCAVLEEKCSGRFERYCEFINDLVQDAKKEDFPTKSQAGTMLWYQKLLLYELWSENDPASKNPKDIGKWNLEMLWASILYRLSSWARTTYVNNTITSYPTHWPEISWQVNCFIYGSADRGKSNAACIRAARTLWVGKSLCAYIPGSALNESDTPYVGFDLAGIRPIKFWLGSLESMEMNEDSFISSQWRSNLRNMPAISGIIHYSMTRIVDSTGGILECQDQPIARGLFQKCSSDASNERWLYDFSYQNRPGWRIWIYAKTKQTVKTKNTFTTFTQIQFATNIFSCFLGFSIMQIVQLTLGEIKKRKNLHIIAERSFQGICIFLLLITTTALTAIDMRAYFQGRYSTVFKEKNLDLPIPMIQICNDYYTTYGFTNTSRFADYNVSLDLYTYLRHVGAQRSNDMLVIARSFKTIEEGNRTSQIMEIPEYMVRNSRSGAQPWNNCSIPNTCHRIYDPLKGFMITKRPDRNVLNMSHHEERSAMVREEALKLSADLGYESEASIAALTNEFYLDPKSLIAACTISNIPINCGKFSSYVYETGQFEKCLVINVPKTVLPQDFKGSLKTGVNEAFFISLDTREYIEHSDMTSYYGPGTEYERKKYRNESMCSASIPPNQGWEKCCCYIGRSWKLKISNPQWYDSFIQLQAPPEGLAVSGSHIADIRVNFNEKLIERPGNDCSENTAEVCRYPAEEMTNIFKAIQYDIWCGCSYCFKESRKFTRDVTEILGKPMKCCTVSLLTKCYTRYVREAESIDGLYIQNEAYEVMRSMAYNLDRHPENRRFAVPALWRKANRKMIKDAIPDFDLLSNATQERLIDFTRRCFKEPCKRYTYDLFNYQNEEVDDGFMNITVFYGAKESLGTEEIDRWDPAQLFALLFCGYSFTFGIGVVGLCELIYILIQRMRGKTYVTTSEIMHDHLVRGVAALTDQDEDEVRSVTDELQRKRSLISMNQNSVHSVAKTNVKQIKVHPQKVEVQKKVSSATKNENKESTGSRKSSHLEVPGSIEVLSPEKLEDIQEMKDSKHTAPQTPENQRAPHQDTTQRVGANSQPEKSDENDESNLHQSDGRIMILVLIVSTIMMGLLLVYTFAVMDDKDYAANVLSSPKIEKPSVLLCVGSLEEAQNLRKALITSVCRVSWSENQNCREYFKMFLKNRDNRFCFIWDNSRASKVKLDQAHSDLVIEASIDMPEVLVSVQGMSRTTLPEISPYLKWKNKTMQLAYSTKLRKLGVSCETVVDSKDLEKCQEDYLGEASPHKCAIGRLAKEPLMLQNPCMWFQYGIAMSLAEPLPHRLLSVKPSQNNVLMFSVNSKLDFTRLLSIVGGFFGSFIEVTILSIFSVVVFMLLPSTYR